MTEPTSPKTDPPPPVEGPSYQRILRHPPFFRVWLAQLVSQSGDFIFEVALIWLVLEATGSILDVSLIVTGTLLPAVLLGPFLGVYIDRWDRRRTLIATNLLQGVTVGGLALLILSGAASIGVIFGIILLLGTGARVVSIGTATYVPSLVAVEDLPPANSLLSLSESFNQIVGLSLGGLFVALLGVTLPIEYDALTFFLSAGLIASVIPASPVPKRPPTRASFAQELRGGLAFIRENRFMIEIIVLGMLVNFFGNGVGALFAPYTTRVLHGNSTVYGFLGAAVAVGSLVGAGAIGKVDTRKSAGRYLLAGGIGVGLSILFLGLVASVPLALVLMLALGITITIANLPMQTLLQAKVPDRLRGRVIATVGALVMATGPAGPLALGWMAAQTSLPLTLFLSGAVITGVLIVAWGVMRALRTIEY